ncbi:DUF1851 domain-containing protein [Granulicoccus phenolivorans]|uniref:DUF1851 domain-containing protein n=1 Tax=Granulicoccus phenolivorans TaxID=266854 RepID=UPI00068550E3|nr:DUF1851 domain-containing protein [Granulicoccus phenolivorans]
MASDNLPAGFRLPLDTIADFRLYTFLDEPQRTAEALPNWPRTHAAFPWVVGYSRFGDFFLQNPDAGKFLVVYPMRGGGSKGYDARDLTEFRETVLDTFDFHLFAFPTMAFVQEVIARVGPIPEQAVYIPTPYPMLGGSGEPSTYSAGDVWVFLDIVGQLLRQAS